MGHSDDLVFQHYQSRIVPVDTQAIAQGQEQWMDQINFTRSMSFGRNLNAPKPRIASLIKSGKRSRIACNSKEEYERERAVKRIRLKQERNDFFESPQAAQLPTPDQSGGNEDEYEYVTDGRITRVRPKSSRWMKILLRYENARADVVRKFFPARKQGAAFNGYS